MAHTVAIINGKAPSGGVGGVSDADLMNIAVNFLTPGVVGANDYLVEQQASPNMTVKVNAGKAYVFNSMGTKAYQTHLDASVNATITSNASGNPRIDAVVIRVDTSTTPNNLASNVASIVVVPGTPAASPSAPSDSAIQTAVGAGNSFYRIADVTVANAASSITTGNISSTRSRVSIAGGLTVTRQDNTTNVPVSSPVIIAGWGYFQVNMSTNTGSETVNFGVTFASKPVVLLSPLGTVIGAVADQGSFTTSIDALGLQQSMDSTNITTTSFKAATRFSGNLGANTQVGYSWIAIGTL